MSARNFAPVMRIVLQHEAGYSDDRRDPGNWTGGKVGVGRLLGTKFGIAANTFPTLDIKNLTQAQAVEIYRRQYANPVRFDDLPAGVDYAVLDVAINSGVGKAGRLLQEALVALGRRVKVDGHVGDATVTEAAAVDARALIDAICTARLAYMRTLKHWKTYGRGWTNRVSDVRRIAKGMVGAAAPLGLVAVDPAPSARGADALKVAWTKLAGLKERAGVVLGIVGERSADLLAQLQPYADGGTIKLVCTVLTVVSVGYGVYRLLQSNGASGAATEGQA